MKYLFLRGLIVDLKDVAAIELKETNEKNKFILSFIYKNKLRINSSVYNKDEAVSTFATIKDHIQRLEEKYNET